MRSYAIGLYEKAMPNTMTLGQKLDTAKACGFDFVELSVDETDEKLARLDWTKEERLAVVQEMYRAGIGFKSMCLSGHRKYPFGAKDPAVRARGLEIMEKAIELADDLGIRVIQLAGYDAYYERDCWEQSKEYFMENLTKATEMAAARGISMGFETMETPFMNTVWKSMFYVNHIDNPWLGVYPDCGNLTNAAVSDNASVLHDLYSGRGHVIAMHLKATKPGLFRDMVFDDPTSHVDFEADIKAAWGIGVRRFVTEMWYLGSDNWLDDIKTANSRMCAILDKQG